MVWGKIKKWFKEKKESLILIRLPISLVVLGLFIFWVISRAVFCYLGLDFSDLREIGGSKETGVTNKDKLIERAFTIIGGIVGGIIAVIGLSALTWRLILMGKQTKSSQEQTKISQKSQYTEQFLKSVEQTASNKLEICLGGLASLDALSREDKKEYKRVWEYLGEFLRYHKSSQNKGEKLHPKVKTIAKMLRERKYKDFVLDLSEVHLERANLRGANLRGTILCEAYLIGADLGVANLRGANLREVNLISADLDGAYLENTTLCGALLGGIMESGEAQDLTRTRLTSDQLRGTFYDEAGPPPKLPDGISEADKPKAISLDKWFKEYRQKKEN